jgi:hypothetical protein
MKTDTLRDVLPLLAPAYEVGDHRRAAARLARDIELVRDSDELADDSPEQTACDEADAEERMYRRSVASGTIKGDSR